MSLVDVLERIQQLAPATPARPPAQLPATAPPQQASTSFADVLGRASAPAASSAVPFRAEIDAAAARYGIEPELIESVIAQESGFDPSAASHAGAQGLMQLMPQTAAGLGVTNPYDPAQSIDGGTRYLKSQLDRFGGDASLALAAYNAGGGAVARYGGIPPYPETQSYVQQVLARYERLQRERSEP